MSRTPGEMGWLCRNLHCRHEQDEHCTWEQGSFWCCQCKSKMYVSTCHTAASNCSSGNGSSCGPARSLSIQENDFDRKLREMLGACVEGTGNLQSEDVAQKAAERVAEWRRNIDNLLDDCEPTVADEQKEEARINGDKRTKSDWGCSDAPTERQDEDWDGDLDLDIDMEGEFVGRQGRARPAT